MELKMTRLRRWINMHRQEFNFDGTLKEEVIQQKLAQGCSQAAIEDYAARLKAQYDEWKRLDEIDPEPWINYSADNFFTQEEKKKFNTDGTLKPEYREYARTIGLSEDYLERLELNKVLEIESFNRLFVQNAENGINSGEIQIHSQRTAAMRYQEQVQTTCQDIRNYEDIDSLPLDIDSDDYSRFTSNP